MFASLTTIDSAFKQGKSLFITAILAFAGLTGWVAYLSFQNSSAASEHVYILSNGQLLTASAQDSRANRPVEAKAHVRRFHELFFSLDPDEKAIQGNINQALYLADNSARREYENLKEKGFYNDMIAANISMEVAVDSVVLSKAQPFTARTYAHQRLIRATSITTRDLVSECALREVTRSENNPHGFLMENWRVLQNTTLTSTAR